MKLELPSVAAAVLGALVMGCGTAPSAPATTAAAPSVGTTRITAGEPDRSPAPRIGKPRFSRDDLGKDEPSEAPVKDGRQGERSGVRGGFSGYK